MSGFTETEYEGAAFRDLVLAQTETEDVRFYGCTFENCDFSEAVLRSCRFSDCKFERCNLSLMRIRDSAFADCSFRKCKILGVDWSEADWPRTSARCTLAFDECSLNHSTFIGLNLRKIGMQECSVKEADFRDSDLAEADLRHSDFAGSLFANTNLTKADFRHAVNYAVSVTANAVKGAKFLMPEAVSLLYHLDIELNDE